MAKNNKLADALERYAANIDCPDALQNLTDEAEAADLDDEGAALGVLLSDFFCDDWCFASKFATMLADRLRA